MDVDEEVPLLGTHADDSTFKNEAIVLLRYAIPSTITFILEQSIQLATIFSVGTSTSSKG
jgi:Na+-driven multidrug efflux pump